MQKHLKIQILFLFSFFFTLYVCGQTLKWHYPMLQNNDVINGRGWSRELKDTYFRLPERFKETVLMRFGIFLRTLQVYPLSFLPTLVIFK